MRFLFQDKDADEVELERIRNSVDRLLRKKQQSKRSSARRRLFPGSSPEVDDEADIEMEDLTPAVEYQVSVEALRTQ